MRGPRAGSRAPRGARPVHPRACGDRVVHGGRGLGLHRFIPARAGNRLSIRPSPSTGNGSSPRVRGPPVKCHLCEFGRRFIPARAGTAVPRATRQGRLPVHPRACGDRVGGERPAAGHVRFIPARAGTAKSTAPSPTEVNRFIPARAGTADCQSPAMPAQSGSSPRVRGPLLEVRVDELVHRFIPARAGTAGFAPASSCASTGSSPRVRGTACACAEAGTGIPVHPRACGDRVEPADQAPATDGSSPRVRGPRRAARSRGAGYPVHPRACGDRAIPLARGLLDYGSSPRVRGPRRSHPVFPDPLSGSSPRVRGPRVPPPGWRRTGSVHPRACGDRVVVVVFSMRGRRFIPARAGTARAPCSSTLRRTGSSPRVRGPRGRAR